MISRRSSGSMRAESAVEPTRSENITVTWRRSAVSCGATGGATGGAGLGGPFRCPIKFGDRAQQLAAMSERRDAESFRGLDQSDRARMARINIVLGKTLRVLDMTELFEPARNLLHRSAAMRAL